MGGAIYLQINSDITIKEDSSIKFTNNSAMYGGGIFAKKSDIYFNKGSTVNFINNSADRYGGAIFSILESFIIVNEDAKLMFYNNIGKHLQ